MPEYPVQKHGDEWYLLEIFFLLFAKASIYSIHCIIDYIGGYHTMPIDFQDCPCSGKNMSYFTAPWILLILSKHGGIHGYELKKVLKGHMEDLRISMNITGLYRHLKLMEKRGVLFSEWDIPDRGPAKRKYSLTEQGKECLQRWMQTLCIQGELINRFLRKANKAFPSMAIPAIQSQDREVSECNL
jgi:DNA-binding PadR family transcriptional regulator